MDFVLTLIAGRQGPGLGEATVAALAGSLAAAGAQAGTPDWLAPAEACDLPFEGLAPETAERIAHETLGGAALDLAAQASGGRRKALLVADLESTIIGQEMLDELAEAVGLRAAIAAVTARAMAGELDFAEALHARVAQLAGLPAAALDDAARRMTLNPGAAELVATMRAGGAVTALVSGGFACFAEPIAEACGFDHVLANRLEIEGGRLTGRVAEPLLDRAAKLSTLEGLALENVIGLEAACAVGDGANDTAMLAAAGLGVAYRGKPPARAAATARIDHGDLTALLFLQGYRRAEFQGQPGVLARIGPSSRRAAIDPPGEGRKA
jgi:phosphoserine phosphatase